MCTALMKIISVDCFSVGSTTELLCSAFLDSQKDTNPPQLWECSRIETVARCSVYTGSSTTALTLKTAQYKHHWTRNHSPREYT